MNAKISSTNSENWEDKLLQTDNYVKDMISFFDEGWDARGADDVKKVEDRLRVNFINTLTYIDKVHSALGELKISPTFTYLKATSYVSVAVLMFIPIDKYLSDDFLKIYPHTSKIEKDSKSEDFSVLFHFSFDEGSINEESLICDGYFRTHPAK